MLATETGKTLSFKTIFSKSAFKKLSNNNPSGKCHEITADLWQPCRFFKARYVQQKFVNDLRKKGGDHLPVYCSD